MNGTRFFLEIFLMQHIYKSLFTKILNKKIKKRLNLFSFKSCLKLVQK